MRIKDNIKLLGAYLFRWFGFSTEPCLIKVGKPDSESPIFLTCNFNLTVKRVLSALKHLDCYLLIAPSKGINVWCGACGDDFNTDSVLSIIKTSKIENLVSHRVIILPQLSAPGIDPVIIKQKTGWNVNFGPVYAKDIPEYIENKFTKTEKQRIVRFSIKQRIEMANMYFVSLSLIFTVIFWIIATFLPILNLLLFLNSIFIIGVLMYGALILLPNFPFNSGKLKVIFYEAVINLVLILLFFLSILNLFYLIWNSLLSVLISLIIVEDFHGLTPIYKSELGERTWEKGEKQMKFLFNKYKLQPYGKINLEREKCIGCKVCIEVCPMNLYSFNKKDNKADLVNGDKCINCNACVKRCLAECIEIS